MLIHESPLTDEKTRKWSKEQKVAVARKRRVERQKVLRSVVKDTADLLVPGYVLGWMGVSSVTSAMASCVSSMVSIWEMWRECR